MDCNYLVFICRIIMSVIVIFFLPVPIWMKYIYIFFSDGFDADPKHPDYHYTDKLFDSIEGAFLLTHIRKYLGDADYKFVFYLYIYRLIGVVLYLKTGNRNILLYFPNFFLEMSFALIMIDPLGLQSSKNLIIAGIVAYKLAHEYYHHKIYA